MERPEFILSIITAAEIERAYSQLCAKKNLSGSTLNKLHILLKSVFEKACDFDLVLRNPCNKVEAPGVDKPERKSLTKEEGAKLLHELGLLVSPHCPRPVPATWEVTKKATQIGG